CVSEYCQFVAARMAIFVQVHGAPWISVARSRYKACTPPEASHQLISTELVCPSLAVTPGVSGRATLAPAVTEFGEVPHPLIARARYQYVVFQSRSVSEMGLLALATATLDQLSKFVVLSMTKL